MKAIVTASVKISCHVQKCQLEFFQRNILFVLKCMPQGKKILTGSSVDENCNGSL